MNIKDIEDLIKDVSEMRKPNRMIDQKIFLAAGALYERRSTERRPRYRWPNESTSWEKSRTPELTRSIDACRDLIAKMMPGYSIRSEVHENRCFATIWPHGFFHEKSIFSGGATEPIACCIIILKAILEEKIHGSR